MRKQIGYDFRLLRVSAIDPTASREELSVVVNGYLVNGWEILSVQTIRAEGNEAFSAYHFVKYDDINRNYEVQEETTKKNK